LTSVSSGDEDVDVGGDKEEISFGLSITGPGL
jgi:hypothetical protein